MRASPLANVIAIASIAYAPFACASKSGNIVDDVADGYDFVIVGGGLAGLVLGNRLSEDGNHTVLVLESGGNGDEFRKRIDTPAYAYFDSLWTTPLNWNFTTVAQSNVANRQISWPRGKTLGGSSAINGLYMTRPGQIEIDAWKDMLGDMDGAENWSWTSFYGAVKKSETFTPPIDSIIKEADIEWDSASHGTNGPIHMSYPGYTFPEVGHWSTALNNLGIATGKDMYGGENWGTAVSASCINPSNWTRSYSRTGYLDSISARANYDVLVNAHVTRIVFDTSHPDNLTATGVEYTHDGGATKLTVKVNKEVILAAGSIGSPTVLLYSGVGPKDVLTTAGVKVLSELPGVGQHLQDHLLATVRWNTSSVTAGSIFYQNLTDKDNTLYLSYIDSAIAYINSTAIYGNSVSSQQKTILSQMDQYTPKASTDKSVIAGYEAIYNTTASTIFSSPLGQVELLFMNSDANGDIGITAALQHPYSHGQIYINSANPMDYPVIDPSYLSHPADFELMREGLKFARRLGQTSPMKDTLEAEIAPGLDVQSDEDWGKWLRTVASTEFHPSSSCAMLPRAQGGVVDAHLRVYGLSNVRVADASVPPIAFSSHLMGSTYGIAERASEVIRADYGVPLATVTNGTASGQTRTGSSNAGGSSSGASGGSSQKNGAGTRAGADIPSLALFTVLGYFAFTNTFNTFNILT